MVGLDSIENNSQKYEISHTTNSRNKLENHILYDHGDCDGNNPHSTPLHLLLSELVPVDFQAC